MRLPGHIDMSPASAVQAGSTTFCKHGPFKRLAASCQYRSMAVKATVVGSHHFHIAELWFVKQAANSGEMGSLVLSQIFVQHLRATTFISTNNDCKLTGFSIRMMPRACDTHCLPRTMTYAAS